MRLSNDGLVYVCDRVNDRIQVFRKDGTFVKEFRVEPQTLANGSVWDLVLSEDPTQMFIFIADGANNQIVTLRREDGEVLTAWGRGGRMAGSAVSRSWYLRASSCWHAEADPRSLMAVAAAGWARFSGIKQKHFDRAEVDTASQTISVVSFSV